MPWIETAKASLSMGISGKYMVAVRVERVMTKPRR